MLIIVLLIVKSAKGLTPVPTSCPSRPSFDIFYYKSSSRLLKTIKTPIHPLVSIVLALKNATHDIRTAATLDLSMRLASMTCAHIFLESFNPNIRETTKVTIRYTYYSLPIFSNFSSFTSICGLCMSCHEALWSVPRSMVLALKMSWPWNEDYTSLFDILGIWFEATLNFIHLDLWSLCLGFTGKRLINVTCVENIPHIHWVLKIRSHSRWTIIFSPQTHDTSCCMPHVPKWPIFGDDAGAGEGWTVTSSCRLSSLATCRWYTFGAKDPEPRSHWYQWLLNLVPL